MKDNVPFDTEEFDLKKTDMGICQSDIFYDIKMQYRYFRKKISKFAREAFRKNFTTILYVAADNIPKEYILAFQRQYPDKILQVLLPCYKNEKKEKEVFHFNYFLQNKKHTGYLYKEILAEDNIQVYEIFSDAFLNNDSIDIYDIKYLAHYAKCARIAIKKIKPNLIHSNNIPLLLGTDVEQSRKSFLSTKIVQSFHDFSFYSGVEPFWAVINLLDKQGMKYLCKDKIIKKNIAALFGMKKIKNIKTLKHCLQYLYDNYEEYKNKYGLESNTNENILLHRLDKRALQIFKIPFMNGKELYNPMLCSACNSNVLVTDSRPKEFPDWLKKYQKDYIYIKPGYTAEHSEKIAYHFNSDDFRTFRKENKKYIEKEFSQKRLEAKFTDTNLFRGDVHLYGYIDSFYNGALVFIKISKYTKEDDIKASMLAILKAFELRKNIQVIINIEQSVEKQYRTNLIEFFTEQELIEGKWVIVEGNVNIAQFVSSCDMVLIPSAEELNIENFLYTSLKYGCIPVVSEPGICDEIITDIFDDMVNGCAFKKGDSNDLLGDLESTLIKAINFYTYNYKSWNLLIKNAMNVNNSWDFNTIEKYNNVYESI